MQWYQLVSHELPNAAPPTYGQGDGVQVVDKVDPIQLSTSPVARIKDDVAKHEILRTVHSADPPLSPSSRGGSDRYIVRRVLDAVRQATGMHWADRDLMKHADSLVKEMMTDGWLRVEDVKVGRNKRQGVVANWASTPWAHEFTRGQLGQQRLVDKPRQIPQMPFEAIDASRDEGIDARRTEGASNVPKRYGDLTQPGSNGAQTALAAPAPAEATQISVFNEPPVLPKSPTVPPLQSSMPASSPCGAAPIPADNVDGLDIPPFLRRGRETA